MRLNRKIDAIDARDATFLLLCKDLVKCPESGCGYETEAYYMKIHLANKHGIIKQQLQIRESKESEYNSRPYSLTWSKDGSLDISQFIKVQGVKLNDKIVYDPEPAEGALTLANNFLTGHLRTRGRTGGQYPYNYLEFIDRVFGRCIPERTIEVCSNKIRGYNKYGDCVTVDINPDCEPDWVGDGQTLEDIRDEFFERWRCDPPYNEKTSKEMYGTELPSLYKLLEAGGRVVKPGSLMFLLCSQNVQSGTIGKGNIKRIGFINISVVPNNETRILNIYVKLPEPKAEESE
jgi:hypothetical protein